MLTPQEIEILRPLLRASYAGQNVLDFGTVSGRQKLNPYALFKFANCGHLSLRYIESLTNDEKEAISKYMQVYPEDLTDWINGDCCHEDFVSMWTWVPCIQFLYQIGIALPLYVHQLGRVVTVAEQVEAGLVLVK